MNSEQSRRDFLKRAGVFTLTGAAGPLAMNLAAFGEAAAAGATDYKALVCVFLYGGNDQANTVVPIDSEWYPLYRDERPDIYLKMHELVQLNALSAPEGIVDPFVGRQYALNLALHDLADLFHAGQLAVMMNVGNLTRPTSISEFAPGAEFPEDLPPKLFSHNDQQSYTQSDGAEGNTRGWGGGFMKTFVPDNGNATFSCISVGGNGVFLSGENCIPYQVATTGAVAINAIRNPLSGSAACAQAMKDLITTPRANLFEAQHAAVVSRSIDAEAILSPALAGAPASHFFPAGNPLADQLSMVARIIAARANLNSPARSPKRQVFMVGINGFDTHDHLTEVHPKLLSTVGKAMFAFYKAIEELGLQNQVTTFTASDFGRTLNSDGDGSDHGWGSMHFVMGGDVNGRRLYGEAPVPGHWKGHDVGRGRLLPRIAMDQFAAQLGRWFGVPEVALNAALPNLHRFATDRSLDLGFIKLPPA